jgi:hypothetical protein
MTQLTGDRLIVEQEQRKVQKRTHEAQKGVDEN